MNTKHKWKIPGIGILLLLGLWLYWEYPISLLDRLPKENWVRMELEKQVQSDLNGDTLYMDIPMEQILTQLDGTTVSRAAKKEHLEDEVFRITLYKGEAWPTVIYVGPSGRVDVAADMQFDDWKYYEGGEVLYTYLKALTLDLPAVYPAA